MLAIYHDLTIAATPEVIFELLSTPEGLEKWWTHKSEGECRVGARMHLYFSEVYDWEAEIVEIDKPRFLKYKMTRTMDDWSLSTLSFELINGDNNESGTTLRFAHEDWKELNAHYRHSNYYWALYLRILKRYIEEGEFVPYASRTSV